MSSHNIEPLYQAITVTLFPIMLIWVIFAIIKHTENEQKTLHHIRNTLDVLRQNNDFNVNLCTTLLSVEQELKNGFVMRDVNTLISDTNEILADIIKRSNSISSTQMEYLWTRTAGGERWLIAKTFIETYTFQSGFAAHLLQKARKNALLKGSILEFQTRYVALRDLLENYDKQRLFYNMIEYGALGKVYNLLTPIAEELAKEPTSSIESHKTLKVDNPQLQPEEELLSFPSFLNAETSMPNDDFSSQKKNIDSGLKAIRDEILATPTLSAPKQDIPPAPTITDFASKRPMSKQTKKPVISLDELEKEINASPENNYDEYAYPFGAWTNAKNNK